MCICFYGTKGAISFYQMTPDNPGKAEERSIAVDAANRNAFGEFHAFAECTLSAEPVPADAEQ